MISKRKKWTMSKVQINRKIKIRIYIKIKKIIINKIKIIYLIFHQFPNS